MKKKNCTPRVITIPCTIYPSNTYVFMGTSVNDVIEHMKKVYPDVDMNLVNETMLIESAGYSIMLPEGSVFIYVRRDHINDITTIVHEAFHATEYILWNTGMEHNPDTSEAFAYLLQYIVKQILE